MKKSPFRTFLFLLVLFGTQLGAQTFWVQRGGGFANDEAADVDNDPAGNLYYTGYYSAGASFGTFNLNAAGITDVFLAKTDAAGVYQWAVTGGGSGSDRAESIKVDAQGNSYITGFFYNTATFGTANVTSAGAQDVFVAKYNSAGVLQWLVSGGGAGADIGHGITVDNSGNVIITGEFSGTATFGSQTLTSMNGSIDVFTVKYSSTGTALWAKKGSAHLNDQGTDVDCDASGNIFITGQFSDTITFDQVHNNTMLNAVFVVKYDPSGNEVWFRRIGGASFNFGNSITVDVNNKVILAGDFSGTVTFFGNTNTNLSGLYSESIFIARYDNNGTLDWAQSDASESQVTARSVTSDASGNYFIGGLFKCRFTEYNTQYGASTFNSVGFWDVFATKYNNVGSFIWSRQYGSKKNDNMGGVALSGGEVVLAGSFEQDLFIPTDNLNFTLYGPAAQVTTNIVAPALNCNDLNYNDYTELPAAGGSDAFIGKIVDISRLPYDFYYHQSGGCNLDTVPVCIIPNALDYLCFGDTVSICQPQPNAYLQAASQTSQNSPANGIGPDWTYLWSTGATTANIFTPNQGNYTVTITSADGCFTSTDTVYLHFNPVPNNPTVTDNYNININDSTPQLISICGDSVILTGGNFGGNPHQWIGTNVNDTSTTIVVDTSGYYSIMVTNQYGCSNLTTVQVIISDPFDSISPGMFLIQDIDLNDSVSICDNENLFVMVFDSITNPTVDQTMCIEDLFQVQWTITPSTILFSPTTNCGSFTINNLNPNQTGWYSITGAIIRRSACDTDTVYITHNYYIEVLPTPPSGSFTIPITGDTLICPGDSVVLTASGPPQFLWSTGDTTASIVVTQPGSYTVSYADTTTNSFGCSGIQSWSGSVVVNIKAPPTLIINPGDGVICPGDSVQLLCSGTGLYQWQGPNGPVGGNTPFIYVTTPGTYYCVLTDADGCQLVSNSVVIGQYNTPYLQAMPAPILCGPGDTVTISVVSGSSSQVVWQAPLSGNATTQYITTPGTYTCLITACGITTPTSITVTGTTVSAQATILGPYPVCAGDSTVLMANTGPFTYLWNPGAMTGDTVIVTTSGTYALTVTDAAGCTAQDTVQVNFQPNNLNAPFATDTSICIGQFANLVANGSGGSVFWYSTASLNGSPIASGNNLTVGPLFNNTTYYIVVNDGLCQSPSSAVDVTMENCPPFVPNVFSPDGDGNNDNWMVYFPGADNVHVWIYNRWGQLIYEFSDVYKGWDGTVMQTGMPASDGVYYYVAEVAVPSLGIDKHTGFLHLIRGGGK